MKIVSHKVAKLAREKGFNEKVFAHFGDDGILGWTSGKLNYSHNSGCAAPSQYSLQNWLLTKHNIWVEPIFNQTPYNIDDYGFRCIIYTEVNDINRVMFNGIGSCMNVYPDPWKALDNGLYEALKLIS